MLSGVPVPFYRPTVPGPVARAQYREILPTPSTFTSPCNHHPSQTNPPPTYLPGWQESLPLPSHIMPPHSASAIPRAANVPMEWDPPRIPSGFNSPAYTTSTFPGSPTISVRSTNTAVYEQRPCVDPYCRQAGYCHSPPPTSSSSVYAAAPFKLVPNGAMGASNTVQGLGFVFDPVS